jgi:putative membrane protein
MRYRSVILWGLFLSIILLGVLSVIQEITGRSSTPLLNISGLTVVGKLILGLAALLLILHSLWTLGISKGTVLVALSFVIGLVFEILGVNYGMVFGGHYIYNPAVHPRILNVPLLIPLIWAGFIYAGHSIVSSFSVWLNRKEPGTSQLIMVNKLSCAVLSALVVLAIDLFMDPLQVAAGNWKWLSGGRYFNIPTGNFLGWFLVAFLSIAIFMILQDRLPARRENFDRPVLLIPVLGYGVLCGTFTFWALRIGMFALVAIGLIAMAPTVIANLSMFLRWRTRTGRPGLNHAPQSDML